MYFLGIPLETLDLSPEFGSLNFEDLDVDQMSDDDYGSTNVDYDNSDEDNFETKMQKVLKIMEVAGDDISVATFKTMMRELMATAKEESSSSAEQRENEAKVGSIVSLFMEGNAHRAQQDFENRRPKTNPVQEQIKAVMEQVRSSQEASENDLSHILIEKAKKKPSNVVDFEHLLDLPNAPREPPTPTPTPIKDFSQILFDKAKKKPESVRDFNNGLRVPDRDNSFNQESASIFVEDYEYDGDDGSEFSEFGQPKDSPTPASFTPSLPDHAPEMTTTITELLKMPESKEKIEDHIMDMIIENPNKAAADLAGLFDHDNSVEKEDTEQELSVLMEKDPLAVTAAFTDLIVAQKNAPLPAEPPMFVPHKIEDPPKEVEGKLLRMTMKPDDKKMANNPNRVRMHIKQPAASDVEVAIGSSPEASSPNKIPLNLLDTMIAMIENGEMSHADVIEEMINNGLLPVEVTEIGRIPIQVGTDGGSGHDGDDEVEVISLTGGDRQQPLRQPPVFRQRTRDREEVSLGRLQQLRARQPVVMRDEHHTMVEVGGHSDPNSDFEMVDLGLHGGRHRHRQPEQTFGRLRQLPEKPEQQRARRPTFDFQPEEQRVSTTAETETEEENNEKDIEILSSMMQLYEQGMLTDQELEQMIIQMEEDDILDIDLDELGLGRGKPESLEQQGPQYEYMDPSGAPPPPRPDFGFPSKPDQRPFFRITQQAHDELDHPFRATPPHLIGDDDNNNNNGNRNPPTSFMSFKMGDRPAVTTFNMGPGEEVRSLPQPPPPSPSSPPAPPPPRGPLGAHQDGIHSAPFFKDLGILQNPFKSEIEDDFELTRSIFSPESLENLKQQQEQRRPSSEEDGGHGGEVVTIKHLADPDEVRPGPAPPYYMSARLPAPPQFNMYKELPDMRPPPTVGPSVPPPMMRPVRPPMPPMDEVIEEVPFLDVEGFTDDVNENLAFGMRPLSMMDHHNVHSVDDGKGELFGVGPGGPREPFAPPPGMMGPGPQEPFPPPPKLQKPRSLPLVLRAHDGSPFPRPHFDVGDLLDPKSVLRPPRQVQPQQHQHAHEFESPADLPDFTEGGVFRRHPEEPHGKEVPFRHHHPHQTAHPIRELVPERATIENTEHFESSEFEDAFRPSPPFPRRFSSRRGQASVRKSRAHQSQSQPQQPEEILGSRRTKRKLALIETEYPIEPLPFKQTSTAGLTGHRAVDRKLELIRQSYLKNDEVSRYGILPQGR